VPVRSSMNRRPGDEGIGLFLALDIGCARGAGFGVALNNIALGTGFAIGAPPGTAVWISKYGNGGDG